MAAVELLDSCLPHHVLLHWDQSGSPGLLFRLWEILLLLVIVLEEGCVFLLKDLLLLLDIASSFHVFSLPEGGRLSKFVMSLSRTRCLSKAKVGYTKILMLIAGHNCFNASGGKPCSEGIASRVRSAGTRSFFCRVWLHSYLISS